MHRNELNGALMNGSRVRDGEGRFITFYFIIFYTISFFIYKKNTKVINLPSPSLTLDPYLVIKRQRGILKTQSSFSDLPQRFQNTPLFYSKQCRNESIFKDVIALNQIPPIPKNYN